MRGRRRGAAAARGLGRPAGRGRSRETRRGEAGGAARRGTAPGPPGAGRECGRAPRGVQVAAPPGRGSPRTCAGGVAGGLLPPALPTCWPPEARLTLNARSETCLRCPARVPSLGAEIRAFDMPRRSRHRPNGNSHTNPRWLAFPGKRENPPTSSSEGHRVAQSAAIKMGVRALRSR